MAKSISAVAMLAASWLINSWLLMILVGIVHLHWLTSVPTIPFTFSLLLCSLLLARALFAATLAEIIKGINR